MKVSSAVTSISWIPSEAVTGAFKLPFEVGMAHYDQAPPDRLADLEELRAADRFRFANHLEAWIEVEDGAITGHGQDGGGLIGSTTMRFGGKTLSVAAVAYPDMRPDPEVGDGWVRFRQTAGGRTGMPAPRRVSHPPYVQITAPTAWTTLELTLHADGRSEGQLVGASPFPRHWVYDGDGALTSKSGVIEYETWSREAFGEHSPWGDQDRPVLLTEIETALERELSSLIMRGGEEPSIRSLDGGEILTEQGMWGSELYLLLDGVLMVEVDGEPIAEVGPGAVLGERAIIERGKRTATLRAVTRCKVAVATAEQIDRDALIELAAGHRREEQ